MRIIHRHFKLKIAVFFDVELMASPRVSIITVCYNNYSGLKRTMASVVRQNYANFEWIIVDGCSQDNTLELLDEIRQCDIVCKVLVEADNGIYDAMNKGIDLAQGDYCLFLNSGDYFYNSSVLADVQRFLVADIIVGEMQEIHPLRPERNRIKSWEKRKLNRSFFYNRTLPHQATFIRRNLFSLYGPYETRFKIKGDHDFFARVCLAPEVRLLSASVCVSVYFVDGVSSQMKNSVLDNVEKSMVHKRNFSKMYLWVRKIISGIKSLWSIRRTHKSIII